MRTFNLADLFHLGGTSHKAFSFAALSLSATPLDYQRRPCNASVFFGISHLADQNPSNATQQRRRKRPQDVDWIEDPATIPRVSDA